MKSRPLSLNTVIDTIAEDVVASYLDGGWGRVPDLTYVSLIYGVDEDSIYRRVKEVQKRLLKEHQLAHTESA